MDAIRSVSANERSFGVGPEMFKNFCESFSSVVVGIAVAALGIGYSVGQYAAGATFTATIGFVGASAIAGLVAAIIVFQCIKER